MPRRQVCNGLKSAMDPGMFETWLAFRRERLNTSPQGTFLPQTYLGLMIGRRKASCSARLGDCVLGGTTPRSQLILSSLPIDACDVLFFLFLFFCALGEYRVYHGDACWAESRVYIVLITG